MTTENVTPGLALSLKHASDPGQKDLVRDSSLAQDQTTCMHESDSGVFLTPQSQIHQSLTCDSLVNAEGELQTDGEPASQTLTSTIVTSQPSTSDTPVSIGLTLPNDVDEVPFQDSGNDVPTGSTFTAHQTDDNLRPEYGGESPSSGNLQPIGDPVLDDTFMKKTKYVVLQFLQQTASEQSVLRHQQTSLSNVLESEHHLKTKNQTQKIRQRWQDNKSQSVPSSPGGSKPHPLARTKDNKSSPDLKDAHFFRDIPTTKRTNRKSPAAASHDFRPKLLQNVQTEGFMRSISQNTDSSEPSTYNSDADDELDSSFESSQLGSVTSISFRNRLTNVHSERLPTLPSEAELVDLSGPELLTESESRMAGASTRTEDAVSPEMIILEDKPLPNVHGFERDDPGGNYESQGRLFQIGDLDGLDCVDVLLTTPQQGSDDDADIPCRSRKATLRDSDATEVGESREVEEGACGDCSRPRFDRSRLSLNLQNDQQAPSLNNHLLSFYRELDEEISSFESEFDDGFEGQLKFPSSSSSSSHSLNHSRSLTPETEAARILMAIGDDIERRYHNDLTRAARYIVSDLISGMFTYEQFREAASAVLEQDLEGWQQVAAVMLYSQHVTMQMVQTGLRGLNFVVDCTVRLLAEKAAGFIIRQGGWAGIHPSGHSAASSSSEETKPLIYAVIDSILPTQTASVDKPQTDETDFPDGINTAPVDGHQLQEADPLDIPSSGNRLDPSPGSSEHQQTFFEAISRPVDGAFNLPETMFGGESVKEITPADPATTAEVVPGNAAQGVDNENSKPPALSEPLMHSHLLPVCAGFVSFAAIGTAIMLNLFRN